MIHLVIPKCRCLGARPQCPKNTQRSCVSWATSLTKSLQQEGACHPLRANTSWSRNWGSPSLRGLVLSAGLHEARPAPHGETRCLVSWSQHSLRHGWGVAGVGPPGRPWMSLLKMVTQVIPRAHPSLLLLATVHKHWPAPPWTPTWGWQARLGWPAPECPFLFGFGQERLLGPHGDL